MDKTVTLEQAQEGLRQLVEEVRQKKGPYVLTRAGEPQVLIIAIEDYEELLEELALLSSDEHIRRVAEARAAYQAGEGGDYEMLRRKIWQQHNEDV